MRISIILLYEFQFHEIIIIYHKLIFIRLIHISIIYFQHILMN